MDSQANDFKENKNVFYGQHRSKKTAKKFAKLFPEISLKNIWSVLVKRRFEHFFWMAVYISCAVLSIVMTAQILKEYRMNTLSLKSTPEFNKTTKLPDIAVCLPIQYNEIIDSLKDTNSLITQSYPKESLIFRSPTLYNDALNEFLANHTTWKDVKNDEWPFFVVYLTHYYLAVIYDTENIHINDRNPMVALLERSNNESIAIIDHLIPALDKWNVNIDQFKETFGKKFQIYSYIHAFIPEINRVELMNSSDLRVVDISMNQLCYKLDLQNISFGAERDRIVILTGRSDFPFIYKNDLYSCWDLPRCYQDHYNESISIHFSGNGRPTSSISAVNYLYTAKYSQNVKLVFNQLIQYVALSDVHGTPSCATSHISKQHCISECRYRAVKRQCNCSSCTLLEYSTNTKEISDCCLFQSYQSCLLSFAIKEDAECVDACLEPCSTLQYKLTKSLLHVCDNDLYASYLRECSQDTDGTGGYEAIIELLFDTSIFHISEEIYDWSVERLIGDVGGAIGLWLGLDSVTIVHAVLTTPLMLIISYYFRNHVTDENTDKSSAVHTTMKIWKGEWRSVLSGCKKPKFIKFFVSKSIWIILFFTGVALTAKMFGELMRQYREESTRSDMKFMANDTMTLPPAMVCHEVDTDLYWGLGSYTQEEFDRYFSRKGLNIETFLGNETWPPSVTSVVHSYLLAHFAFERNDIAEIVRSYIGIQMANKSHISPCSASIEAHKIMLKLGITYEQLQQKFSTEFFKLNRVSAHTENINGMPYDGVIYPTKATLERYPGGYSSDISAAVCYHLPLDKYRFLDINDKLKIRLSDIKLMNTFLTFESKDAFELEADVHIGKDMASQVEVSFTYESIRRQLPTINGEKRCSDEKLRMICVKECYYQALEMNCRCTNGVPYMADALLNNTDCSWDRYSVCMKTFFKTNWNRECKSLCKWPACNRPYFALGSNLNLSVGLATDIEFIIKFSDFSYPFIDETVVWTTYKFFAAIGGVLGFWLGLDAVYLLRIVLTPTMALLDAYLKRKYYQGAGWLFRVLKSDLEDENYYNKVNSLITKIASIDFTKVPCPFILKEIFELLFWSFIYLSSFLLTLSMAGAFSREYFESPSTFTYNLMRNQSITLPEVTFCVPLLNYELSEKQENVFEQRERKNLKFDNVIAPNMTKDLLLAADTEWPFPLLQLAHQLLVLTESYKAADVIDPKAVWKSFNSTGMDSFVNATDAFGDKLEELDISVNDLFKKFDLELRKIYEINASKFDEINGTLVEKILNVKEMTFVSEKHVCYQLPLNGYSFNSVKEYIRIRVDSNRVPSVRYSCSGYSCIYTGPVDKITLDIPGRDIGAIAGGQLPFSVEVMQIVNTQLSIRTATERLPELEGVEKCSKTITLEECKVHCRLKAVEKQCSCVPESTSTLQPLRKLREKVCSWKQLKSCLPNFDTAAPPLCMKACLPECYHLQYSKTEAPFRFSDGVTQVFVSPTAEYILNVMSFEYPVYTEKVSWTFWSFIAGMGGILGIWFSFDVIIVTELLYAALKWILKTVRKVRFQTKTDEAVSITDE